MMCDIYDIATATAFAATPGTATAGAVTASAGAMCLSKKKASFLL
jgi:hypothetical protein